MVRGLNFFFSVSSFSIEGVCSGWFAGRVAEMQRRGKGERRNLVVRLKNPRFREMKF